MGEMKRYTTKVAAALTVALLLASCSTFQRMSDERGASWVARMLGEGNAAGLAKASSSPFLLDGEIVALSEDTTAFWDGMVKAGLSIDPELSRALPVGGDAWREFGSTRDVKVFFGKYVAEGARLFELPSAGGRHVLVLYRSSWGSRTIYGFKGPY